MGNQRVPVIRQEEELITNQQREDGRQGGYVESVCERESMVVCGIRGVSELNNNVDLSRGFFLVEGRR